MTLQRIVDQLRSCNYECEAGALENNVAFIELERQAQEQREVSQLDSINALLIGYEERIGDYSEDVRTLIEEVRANMPSAL